MYIQKIEGCARRAFRNWALPLAVLAAGWALSRHLYVRMAEDRERYDESRAESIAAGIEADLQIRLTNYENALRFAAADLADSDRLFKPGEWQDFVNRLGLLHRYPGATAAVALRPVADAQVPAFIAQQRALGSKEFDLRLPTGARPPAPPLAEHFVIVRAEPPAVAARALGTDIAVLPLRKAAAEQARDTGSPVLTRNELLSTKLQDGLVLYVPVYRHGAPLNSVQERRAALTAWVTVALSAEGFFHSAMRDRDSYVDLNVFEGAVAPGNLLFSTNSWLRTQRPFERTSTLALQGGNWTLGWNRAPHFPFLSKAPSAFAAGGCALAALFLAALVLKLQSAARRAQARLAAGEQEAERTKAFLVSLVGSSDDSIVGTHLDGTILSWNDASQRLWGYSAEEAIGRSITMLYSTEGEADFRTRLARISRDEPERFEAVRVKKDGTRIDVSVIVSPVKDASGRLLGASGIYRDITSRKRADRELCAAKDAAEAASRAKSEFLANMSHELRTPLNGMLGLCQVLLDSPLDEQQCDYLNTTKICGESLLRTIEDILQFSEAETGRIVLERKELSLHHLIDTVLKEHAGIAWEKGLRLTWKPDRAVPRLVMGDQARLRRVVGALVGNATKFTSEGEVEVALRTVQDDPGTVQFTVRDTGPGIPLDQQRIIFEAFRQADGSVRRRFGGIGLGLAASARLVELMGGQIWVESDGRRGSAFHFTARLAALNDGGNKSTAWIQTPGSALEASSSENYEVQPCPLL